MGCATLLLAAGSGTRFGPDAPKVLTRLQGRPVLLWSLDAMIAAASVDHIVIMVSEQTMDAVVDLVEGVETDKILDIVLGCAFIAPVTFEEAVAALQPICQPSPETHFSALRGVI